MILPNQSYLLAISALTEFSEGFWWGVIVFLVLGFGFFLLNNTWKKIRAFFQPSQVAVTKPGDSPANRMSGCILTVPKLLFGVAVLTFILWFVFG